MNPHSLSYAVLFVPLPQVPPLHRRGSTCSGLSPSALGCPAWLSPPPQHSGLGWLFFPTLSPESRACTLICTPRPFLFFETRPHKVVKLPRLGWNSRSCCLSTAETAGVTGVHHSPARPWLLSEPWSLLWSHGAGQVVFTRN